MKRTIWRLTALVAALFSVAVTAMPAQAASLPILDAIHNDMAHVCASTATDPNGWRGVVCADILTSVNSDDTNYYATGQTEAFCEHNNVITHCAEINFTGGLYRQSNTSWEGDTWTCGSSFGFGPCPGDGQREYYQENTLGYNTATWEPQCASNAGGYTALWSNVHEASFAFDDSYDYAVSVETGHDFVCAY